ncbi:MAG: hypothetical protein HDR71_15935 [Lachnospiraceae bacterium]|nr:hypothetical protein [Lachnospiraceae bacterium]
MKKYTKIILTVILIIAVLVFMIFAIMVAFRLGHILGRSTIVKEQIQDETDRVEAFFEKKGYEIEIIGAHTDGREHEGPFMYGWWKCFEIGPEVVMLYYYDDSDEIDGYLAELDERAKNKCYISQHFVFYYVGNDADIINTIKEFCEFL